MLTIKKYGYADWFDWATHIWGTKWNACDADTLDVMIPMKKDTDLYSMTYRFATAWSIPKGIYEVLSRRFPDITMVVKYADEDYGQNCGHIFYQNGEVNPIHVYEPETKEAITFAMRIWNHEEQLRFIRKDTDGHWFFDVDAYDDYLESLKK